MRPSKAYVVEIGGPVGAGKTTLVNCLCTEMRDEYSIGVIVNDIHGPHDARYLQGVRVLETARIFSIVTGRVKRKIFRQNEDLNRQAVQQLSKRYDDIDIIFIEGVGDRMDSRFCHSLVNYFIYIIDSTDGERLPLKGGFGIKKSELLVVNKVDLLDPKKGRLGKLSLNIQKVRGTRTYVLAALERGLGVNHIAQAIKKDFLQYKST